MVESIVAFVVVSAVVICTPGQDTALTIRNTLSGGRPGGVATAGGVAVGQAIWTLAASFGIVALLSASEPAFRALKLAGAAYVVYLGLQSLYGALRGRGHAHTTAYGSSISAHRALRQGVVSNLANPKMALFFASLLPQFAPDGRASFAALLALGALFCTMTFSWLAVYAIAVHRLRHALKGPIRRTLDAATGVVLVGFGLRLAAEER
jgi:threonine/homoserine/homoserine lactone efflux protein